MVSDHIKAMLKQNGYTGLAVRVLNEYKPFITRAEGLDNIAAVEKKIQRKEKRRSGGSSLTFPCRKRQDMKELCIGSNEADSV